MYSLRFRLSSKSFIIPALCSLCTVLLFFLCLCSLRLPVIIKVLSYLILYIYSDNNSKYVINQRYFDISVDNIMQ